MPFPAAAFDLQPSLLAMISALPGPARKRQSTTRLLFSGLFLGVMDHPLAQADEWVFVAARHGVGQLAQLDGESVQIPARRNIHQTTSMSV